MRQLPSSAFDRGSSLQATQHPDYAARLAQCKSPPRTAPRRVVVDAANSAPPPMPELPRPEAVTDVLATGQVWKVVWSWEGNNADGPIAGDDGSLLFANNDASNVMQLDPETGLASIRYENTNTGGALSRSKSGTLFLAVRGFNAGIEQLQPRRRMFVNSWQGEPLECAGGTVNDLVADARGGVYVSISGAGVFHATPATARFRRPTASCSARMRRLCTPPTAPRSWPSMCGRMVRWPTSASSRSCGADAVAMAPRWMPRAACTWRRARL
jgi:hypothetical protein